jgi:hypothetical protein
MVTPETVVINSKEFQIRPLPVFQAAQVNASLTAIFGPLLLGQVSEVSKLLLSIPDDRQTELLAKVFQSTLYKKPEGGALELKESGAMDEVFACDLEGMYDLAMKVLEYNKFPFFAKLRKKAEEFMAAMERMNAAREALSPEAQKARDSVPGNTGSGIPETGSSESQTSGDSKTMPPLDMLET